MAKSINILTYGSLLIGVIFLIIMAELRTIKAPDPKGEYTFILPYQNTSFAFLITGITFLAISAFALLVNHFYENGETNFELQPSIAQNDPTPPPATVNGFMQTPKPQSESIEPQIRTPQSTSKSKKLEKEIHIVERYYCYSVTCPYCGNAYDDKLTQCPKCSGKKPA